MNKLQDKMIYSGTDLANFLECVHLTNLGRIHLETPLPKTSADEQGLLIQAKGLQHESVPTESGRPRIEDC